MKESLESAHKFKIWKANLQTNGLKINNIQEIYTRHRYNGEALFSLVMLDAETPEGDKIPPICFIKGEVVCICIVLIDKETKEKYLLLVKQRRIAEGGFTFEHPAGMVDGIKSPLEIAVMEVKEETGIVVSENDLIDLSPNKRLFPSTGTSDEAMYFYFCEITLDKNEIEAFENKEMGTEYEFERITTHVYPFVEGHQKINNSNGLLLNYLYLSAVKDFETLKRI
ncbi:nudix hydrolase [Spirosomataceae bacterium]